MRAEFDADWRTNWMPFLADTDDGGAMVSRLLTEWASDSAIAFRADQE